MRKLPIDLSDLEQAFGDASDEISSYLDLDTGAVVMVTNETDAELKDIHAEVFDAHGEERVPFAQVLAERGLDNWMKEAVEVAHLITVGIGTQYIRVPRDEHWEAYRDLEEFIDTIPDRRLQDRLARAIQGKGAFGRFRDVLGDFPQERERWFAFRDARLRARVLDWLASRDIDVGNHDSSVE